MLWTVAPAPKPHLVLPSFRAAVAKPLPILYSGIKCCTRMTKAGHKCIQVGKDYDSTACWPGWLNDSLLVWQTSLLVDRLSRLADSPILKGVEGIVFGQWGFARPTTKSDISEEENTKTLQGSEGAEEEGRRAPMPFYSEVQRCWYSADSS